MNTNNGKFAILSVALLLMSVASARSQAVCLEGRTPSGKCVKADLAQSMRQSTFLNTQPKLSYTSPPLLPSQDYDNYAPRDFQEMLSLFAAGLPPGPDFSGGARRP